MNSAAFFRSIYDHRQRRHNLRALGFMLPGLIGLCIFYIEPFFTVVRFSLCDNTVEHEFVGVSNFTELFENGSFRHAFYNSMILALLGTFVLIALSLSVAEFLSHAKWFTSVLKTIMLVPFVMPAACTALVCLMCTDHCDFFIGLFRQFGVGGKHSLSDEYALVLIMFLFLWKNMGYFVLLFCASMINVDQSVIEAACLDGAGVIRVFFKIKLRSISPSIVFALLLSVMSSFGMYREVFLIYGTHPPVSAYLISHYLNNTMHEMNYSKMSAAALLIMFCVIIMSVVFIAVEKRFGGGMEQ